MKKDFYKYIKKIIKTIPCSGYFDLSDNYFILEDEFLSFINEKYSTTLINFQQESKYKCYPETIRDEQIVSDTIIYHFKLNNQLYLEYKSYNKNTIESDKYIMIYLSVYSSEINQKELISFLEYMDLYIKNKNK